MSRRRSGGARVRATGRQKLAGPKEPTSAVLCEQHSEQHNPPRRWRSSGAYGQGRLGPQVVGIGSLAVADVQRLYGAVGDLLGGQQHPQLGRALRRVLPELQPAHNPAWEVWRGGRQCVSCRRI